MIERVDNPTGDTPRGAVMVVGAGIAGMQSAIDLADAGFKVYLVDKETSIGGHMAQLDKTFPTNDCAMCTISPRLIDVARHDNIELVTGAELIALQGQAGDFTARLHVQPRYVDMAKCNACGDCVAVCPVYTPAEFEQGTAERTAIHRRFPQATPGQFAISKGAMSPCRAACPAGVNAHGYVALVGKGRFKEAYDLVFQDCPLPSVCGRICQHPCEGQCNRADWDDPVAVRNLKRFVADYVYEHRDDESIRRVAVTMAPPRQEKVAVIGGGPGGLTAAHDLSRRGYTVTLFEELPFLGGMLRVCVPAFRLPRERLDFDIAQLLNDRIEVKLESRLGRDFTLEALRAEGYKAFFLSTGAHKGRSLSIEGAEADGVLNGLEFLRKANTGEPVTVGKRTVVVGGGNVATDAARVALRCGAE
ncbi:MAG: FAD-binding protein, partial [Gemmatimonadales bacterium]